MTDDVELYKRRYEREKKARIEAETLLETKSRELYFSNEELKALTNELEQRVHERTLELKTARDQALAFSHAKSQFLTNMSHEIRTPMNGVLGALHLLATTGLNEHQHQFIHRAKISGDLLLSILNDIIDVSNIEAGTFTFETTEVDLVHQLKTCCDYFQPLAQEKNIHFFLELDTGIPRLIKSDPTRIQQIVNNLLSNAIKFTHHGEIRLRATCVDKDYIEIAVTDSGIGIPSEKIQTIFAPFTQADESLTRAHGGTGLGLAICAHISKTLGKAIQVTSEIGKGSTFTFWLRLDAVKATTPAHLNEKFSDGLIMLVDDNPVNIEIATEILTYQGLRVDSFENGELAINAITQKPYNAVLMDIQMPVMDGLTATRAIRAKGGIYATLPIIAVTAHSTNEDIQKSMSAGMNGHLTKPIDPALLLSTLAQWIPLQTQSQTDTKKTTTREQPAAPVIAKSQLSDDDLPDIEGVDFHESLARVNHNKQLLKKVIVSFIAAHKNDRDVLLALYAEGDMTKLQALAHKLKGSGATLGAKSLAQAASLLEIDCKNQLRVNIKQHIDTIDLHLSNLVKAFEGIPNKTATTEFVQKSTQEILTDLETFEKLMQRDIVNAEKILDGLINATKNHATIQHIKTHFDNFDTDAIYPLLSDFRKTISLTL